MLKIYVKVQSEQYNGVGRIYTNKPYSLSDNACLTPDSTSFMQRNSAYKIIDGDLMFENVIVTDEIAVLEPLNDVNRILVEARYGVSLNTILRIVNDYKPLVRY